MFYLMIQSTHFNYHYLMSVSEIETKFVIKKEENVLFNDTLNTF